MFRIAFVFAIAVFCLFSSAAAAQGSTACEMDPELCELKKDSGVFAPGPDAGSNGSRSPITDALEDRTAREIRCRGALPGTPGCQQVPPPSQGGSTVTPPPTTTSNGSAFKWWAYWLIFVFFLIIWFFVLPKDAQGNTSIAEKFGAPALAGLCTLVGLVLIWGFADVEVSWWFPLFAAGAFAAILPPHAKQPDWLVGVQVIGAIVFLGIALTLSLV